MGVDPRHPRNPRSLLQFRPRNQRSPFAFALTES
jgi:hypothetical protein